VSRRLEFVELGEVDAGGAGAAPYLDYRSCADEERALVGPTIDAASWLIGTTLEGRATDYAIERLARSHLAEVRERTLDRIERTRREVHARLTYEINYWDGQYARLREQERAGKQTRLASGVARQRADDLADRLRSRMRELELEAQVQALPPVVVGGAIVVPRGLLDRLTGSAPSEPELFARETKRIERLAVAAVMVAERAAGRIPEDVGDRKYGWDVESREPGGRLRLIEVKGRAEGATTVTVTRNEIGKCLNVPDRWYLAIVSVDGERVAEPIYPATPVLAGTGPCGDVGELLDQGPHGAG